MKNFKLGWIGFLSREGNIWEQLQQAKNMGYSGVEMGDMMMKRAEGGSFEENLQRLHDMGLEVVSVNANHLREYNEEAIDAVIEAAKITNASYAGCYISGIMYPLMNRPALPVDEFFQEIENLERAAQRMKEAGVTLTYHNHNYEFTTMINGVSAWDQIVSRTSALKFQPDVGWVTFGHEDPVKVLEKLGDRVHAIHFKDYIAGKETFTYLEDGTPVERPHFTAVGSGTLDLLGCAKWAAEHEIDWCCVEQDNMNTLTPMESLQCAMYNIRETGYVNVSK